MPKEEKTRRTGKKPATNTCTVCKIAELITKRELASSICTGCHGQMAKPTEQGGKSNVAIQEGGKHDTGKGTGRTETCPLLTERP